MATVSDVHPSLRARGEAVRQKWMLPGWLLGASMAAAIAFVAALAYWDEERESGAALEDFAREQAALANGVALSVKARLATISERGMHAARASTIPADGYHE